MIKLKSYLHWANGITVFTIGGILLLLVSFLPPERMRYRLASVLARAILRVIGTRLRVEGSYPNDRAYIVMANHASFIDPLILAAIMKDTFTSIVAVEYLHIPLWGWLVKRFRGIPIERKNREAALRSIALAEERLKRGMHVAIMPEGTRTLTGKVGPLKKGGFHMAINCGAPIQVVGIEGAFHIKAKNSNILRSGEVVVRFGKIIPPERYEQATMEAIIKEVRQEFIILSGEASA